LLVCFFGSCSTWKDNLKEKGNYEQAIENSIIDFLNTSNLSKRDKVFSLNINDVSNDILSISIIGNHNKIFPNSDTQIGKSTNIIPTKYIEKNGKLFYWYDSQEILTIAIVKKLSNYKVIDSVNVKGLVVLGDYDIDDSKKGVSYFFCKMNLKKYKKVTTSIAFGYFDIPKLNCVK
jgi:hypothetical protein